MFCVCTEVLSSKKIQLLSNKKHVSFSALPISKVDQS